MAENWRGKEDVRQQVSNYYSSIPLNFYDTVRNTLNGMNFEEQHQFGMDIVQRALSGGLK